MGRCIIQFINTSHYVKDLINYNSFKNLVVVMICSMNSEIMNNKYIFKDIIDSS